MNITQRQLNILQHSLGVDQYGRGEQYRNRFVTDPDTEDGQQCQSLCELGLMVDCGPQSIAGGMHCYSVRDAGKEAVRAQSPKPPKRTRSQERYMRYLEADGSLSFKEWLRVA